MNNKKSLTIIYNIYSEVSLGVLTIIVLFLFKQILIMLDTKSSVYMIYSSLYPFLLVITGIAVAVSITISLLRHLVAKGQRKSIIDFRKRKVFGILNILTGLLFLLLLLNTLGMLILTPSDSKESKVLTVLYDPGSLNRTLIRELITPLAFELRFSKSEISILPITNDNLRSGFENTSYLFVMAHGIDGKLYTTNPLKAYSYSMIRELPKHNLKLVYYSSCYLGVNGNDRNWTEASYPGKVVLYKRESAILEHIIWVVFRAKTIIQNQKKLHLTTASTLQILCHAACRNNNASCVPSPTGTDLKVKRMLG